MRRTVLKSSVIGWDSALGATLATLGLITLVFSSQEHWWRRFMPDSGGKDPVGWAVRSEGVLRARSRGSMLWHEVDQGEWVRDGDRLWTGTDSRALLKISGSEAWLEPGTLLVVRGPPAAGKRSVGFLSRLRAIVQKPSEEPAVRIEVKAGRLKPVATSASARRRPLQVVASKADRIESVALAAPRRDFRPRGAPSMPLSLAPVHEAQIPVQSGEGSAEVTFRWSSDPSFSSELEVVPEGEGVPVWKGASRMGSAHASLAPGRYQWRLRATDGKTFSRWSELRSFTIHPSGSRPAGAPVILTHGSEHEPERLEIARQKVRQEALDRQLEQRRREEAERTAEREKIAALSRPIVSRTLAVASNPAGSTRLVDVSKLDRLDVQLEWSRVPGSESYDVAIYRDGAVFRRARVRDPRYVLTLEALVAGMKLEYEVSVKSGGKLITSGLRPIRIDIAAPALVEPNDGATVEPVGVRTFTWARTVLTLGYEYEVARDPGFERVELQGKAQQNFFVTQFKDPGPRWWRVRSMLSDGSSAWSEPRRIQVR